jgi:hypothetical protein
VWSRVPRECVTLCVCVWVVSVLILTLKLGYSAFVFRSPASKGDTFECKQAILLGNK